MSRKFARSARFLLAPMKSRRTLLLSCFLSIAIVVVFSFFSILSFPRRRYRRLDFNTYSAPHSLYNAWERRNESCSAWISSQIASGAYLDAYVVGAQKSGTTQLTHMLERLKVRRKHMIKEWHFFNHLTADGVVKFGRYEFEPLPPMQNLTYLRLMHYQLGFPSLNISTLPRLDDAATEQRTIVLDSTVEYLHMERAALLASSLTPHVRVIVMIRDPPSRALSQYNMFTRNENRKLRAQGLPDRQSLPDVFDKKVRDEVLVLRKCGYDDKTATLNGNTTRLIRCMRMYRPRFDDVMYVLRGLYFLHIAAWREHFDDSRLLFVPFSDIVRGYSGAYQRIARFLCVRSFSKTLMARVEKSDADLSFGQTAARYGMEQLGPDTYRGNDRYLADMWPSTRHFLDNFYAAATVKLEHLLGRPMY